MEKTTLKDFFEEARHRALELPNRGPLTIGDDGTIDRNLLDSYWKYGFYILEDVLDASEMSELTSEFQDLLQRAPVARDATVDSEGRALCFSELQRKQFRFVKPLTDPYGGTEFTNNRYQIKMEEPQPPKDAPNEVLLQIGGILQFLDSTLRIYGHPKLLALAEAVNGPDFTPFSEVIWLKQPRFGAAVSWHQDGTTHWESPNLDQGTHGFNYMVNMHETTPENSLWVVPGTHKHGKADLKKMMSDSQSDRLEGAIPMLVNPGDVAICNRQVVHGSFPNTSSSPRYTFVFGFHRRKSVEGIQGWAQRAYDAEFLDKSSRLIPMAISARSEKYPDESPFTYKPIASMKGFNWTERSRRAELENYHTRMIGI